MNIAEIYKRAFEIDEEKSDMYYYRGVCYSFGYHNVKVDIEKAKEAYEYGILKGNAKCKYGLAMIFLKEKQSDSLLLLKSAFDDLLSEAKADDAVSQRMVSCYYLFGDRGQQKDIGKAMYWLKKSAKNGDIDAQMNLANCYEDGFYIEKNKEKAKKWYNCANKQGCEKARMKLVEMEKC